MREPHETSRVDETLRDEGSAEAGVPRLAHLSSAAEVLGRVGDWLGPEVDGLEVDVEGPSGALIAAWRRPGACREGARRTSVRLPGDPHWALSVESTREAPEQLARAALILQCWRQSRAEIERSADRLAARARELDALQLLGRRAAEARDAHELVAAVVDSLGRSDVADLVVASYPWDGARISRSFLGRPFTAEYVEQVERRAARFSGAGEHAVPPHEPQRQSGYDVGRPPRADFDEQDLVLLPLERRGQVLGCLAVVPPGPPDDASLRLLYGASNQLGLHLERILAVREAEADRFRAMVEAMPHGVLLIDRALRARQANRAARKMLGERIDAALEQPELKALVERALRGESVASAEVHSPSGEVWGATASAMLDEPGAALGVVLVLSDITESRRLQHELAQSEKMSSLGQMISGVAHELNNPLASIVGYAQLLRGALGGDERTARQLQTLAREAERCKRIVHDLLSFARRHEPEWRPFSLNETVQAVQSLLAYQLRVDDVRVECDLGADFGPLEGDRHRIEQVLVNLLTNARQAIRSTGRGGTIRLRTYAAGPGSVCVEVHDDGPGIPPQIRSRVFDPFFTTKAPGEGTGLGLALVYGIVCAHGGSVELIGGAAEGTTFRVTLPAGAARPTRAVESPEAPLAVVRRGRILVVDDDEPVGRLICEVLEIDGHQTLRVASAVEALSRMTGEAFDLVVCDLRMPGMDGLALIEEAERLRPGVARRTLFMTGDTLGPQTALPEGLGVLLKPFDVEELLRRARLHFGNGG